MVATGLGDNEVQQALNLAAGGGAAAPGAATSAPSVYMGAVHPGALAAPTPSSMGWKDYFIGAVVTSAASYGAAAATSTSFHPPRSGAFSSSTPFNSRIVRCAT